MTLCLDNGLSTGGYEISENFPRQGGAADLFEGSAKISPLSTPLWITPEIGKLTLPDLTLTAPECNPPDP